MSPFFATTAVSQIVLFLFEIFATIYIYNRLKLESDECGTALHDVPVVRPDGRLSLDVCIT